MPCEEYILPILVVSGMTQPPKTATYCIVQEILNCRAIHMLDLLLVIVKYSFKGTVSQDFLCTVFFIN